MRYPSPSENNSTYQHSHEKSKTRLSRSLPRRILGAEYDFDTPAFNVLKEHIELNKFTPHVLDEAEPTFHRVKLAN